jgi:hypothetical protein
VTRAIRLAIGTLSLLLLLSGCIGSDATVKRYVDAGYNQTAIRKIAIIPIVNSRLPLADAQTLFRQLVEHIEDKNPSIGIVSSAEAIRVFNEKGRAIDWTRFIGSRDEKGLPDSMLVKMVGQTLGVDAILQGDITRIEKADGVYLRKHGTTIVTVRYYLMGASAGNLLWDVSSEGVQRTITTLDPALPFGDVIKMAHARVLDALPL